MSDSQKLSTNLLQDSEEGSLNQSYRRKRSCLPRRASSRWPPTFPFPQQQQAIPNDEQQQQIPNDEQQQAIPNDEQQQQQIPNDEQQPQIPNDEQQQAIPNDEQQQQIPNDEQQQAIPNDEPQQEILNDEQQQEIPNDELQQQIPNDEQQQEIPNDELQQQIPNDELQQIQDQPFLGDQKSDEKNSQEEDSDGSGTDPEEFDEILQALESQNVDNNDFDDSNCFAELYQVHKNVQCPICLDIIKNTRTLKKCLHRFCKECIDKSIRLGNHECPVCRIGFASRRCLRDDQLFDKLIKALYPDAEKYEEEELLRCEEDITHIKQVQASIAEVSKLQEKVSIKDVDEYPIEFYFTPDESSSEDSEYCEERTRQRRRRRRRRRRTRILPTTTSPVLNLISWGRRAPRSQTVAATDPNHRDESVSKLEHNAG